MGKKKRKFRKTNQLSVATAEASSTIGEQEQQQQQPQPQPQPQSETRRKRGRPRKVIDKAGETADKAEHGIESESEKVKTGEEEEVEKEKEKEKEKQAEEEEVVRKEELSTSVEERGLAAKEGSTSRGRRKSKPRKSS